MWLFLISSAVLQFVLGLLVMILNIIFIYDGMGSQWYGQPKEPGPGDSLDYDEDGEAVEMSGGGLKVVSIGEGIIAGAGEINESSIIMNALTVRVLLLLSDRSGDVRAQPEREQPQEGAAGRAREPHHAELHPGDHQRLSDRDDTPTRPRL